VFAFNFTELVKPFVSSDIAMGALGSARCIFASLSGIRCTYAGAATVSLMFRKVAEQPGMQFEFVRRNWRKILVIAVCLSLRFLFKRWGEKLTRRRAAKKDADGTEPPEGEAESAAQNAGTEAARVAAVTDGVRKRR
jgi:hypothetical protein